MADRMRDMMKRSGSKLQIGKGSVNHIGTMPYRFKIDIFISYVDNIKSATGVCVTWERRGKTETTNVVQVKDNKAVFRQTISMESTLFRRAPGKSKKSDPDELKFDEKRAKFVLRKGGPDGKGIGKITLNLAAYVRGTTSTVFADMKLSNGSTIATKIEATMMHMGKKVKTGSRAGSEACSEMTDVNSLGNDSIFGDDDADLGDFEIPATSSPKSGKSELDARPSSHPLISPVSTSSHAAQPSEASNVPRESSFQSERSSPGEESSSRIKGSTEIEGGSPKKPQQSAKTALTNLQEEEDLKQSPSLRNKLKTKIREKKAAKKEKEKERSKLGEESGACQKSKTLRASASHEASAEVRELRALVESLKEENSKLRKAKQAAMEEVDALRSDLEACENALEEAAEEPQSVRARMPDPAGSLKEKERKISELQAQNESLLDELEERHEEAVQSQTQHSATGSQMKVLKKKIEDLEVALRREPQYLDVVNELKVTKVSLALANMEKEQALFALQSAKQQFANGCVEQQG